VETAWLEHAPFAFWLVGAQKPRVFVELGTYRGYSFLCVCQAVQHLGLGTRCYAVDTWRGDEHGGPYDGSLLAELRAYHGSRYAGFSELVPATFDEAVEQFEDGSIDLLHLDGRHYYADVKHDFETWFSKLSSRAVVLFHDTTERTFGV